MAASLAFSQDNEDSTYDNNSKVIAMRVSAIIVVDLNEIVRRRFTGMCQEDYCSVEKFFQKNQQNIINLKSKKILSQPQLNKLYPQNKKKREIDKFDVGLCFVLVNNLISDSGYNKSYKFHIDRLRMIRNEYYGHLTTLCFPEHEYVRLLKCKEQGRTLTMFAELEESIYALCINLQEKEEFKNSINKHLNDDIEPSKLDSLKQHMANSILEDRESYLRIIEAIQLKTGEKLDKSITDLKKQYDKNASEASGKFDQITSKFDKIFKAAHKIDETILKEIKFLQLEFDGMKRELADSEERTQSTLNNLSQSVQGVGGNVVSLQATTCSIQSAVDTANSTSKEIQKDVRAIAEALPIRHLKQLGLADFKVYFTDNESLYFKVLILSATNQLTENDNKDKLVRALGGIDWDVIIDLDPKTRLRSGIHDKIKKEMENKNFLVKSYNQLNEITEQDIYFVYTGKWLLYILANGCEDVGIEAPKRFRISSLPIVNILADIVEHIPQKMLLCVNLMANRSCEMNEIDQFFHLNNDFNNSEKFISLEPEIQSIFLLHDNADMNIASLDSKLSSDSSDINKHFYCKAEISQILQAFVDCHKEKKDVHFYLPGLENKVPIEELSIDKSFMDIYHMDYGKCDMIDCAFLKSQRESYLKGNLITPEQLFINSQYKIYADREMLAKIEEKINELLGQRHFFKSTRIINISCELSSGATTLARALLYRFRNRVPCIRIHCIDPIDKLIERLQLIKKKTKLPLLILIDVTDFPRDTLKLETVKGISKQMSGSDSIRSIIIFVSRRFFPFEDNINSKPDSQTNDAPNPPVVYYNLTTDLTKEEIVLFKTIYYEFLSANFKRNDENLNAGSLVFWFGLLAFGKDYQGLEQLTQHFISKTFDPTMKSLIFMICFYYYFSGKDFPLNLAAVRLNEKVCKLYKKLKGQDEKYEALLNFFILKDDSNIARIHPVHLSIAEKIMHQIIGSDDTKKLFEYFYDNFIELTSVSKNKCETDLIEVFGNLFIFKNLDDKFDHYTMLIIQTQENMGNDWTHGKLKLLHEKAKTIEKLHITVGMIYARFSFYEIKNKDLGIRIMKTILKIENKSIDQMPLNFDSQCVTQYGDLLRNKAKELMPVDANYQDFLDLAEEAILAYKKAETLPRGNILKPWNPNLKKSTSFKFNAIAFIGVCKTHELILQGFFIHKCQRDRIKYTEALDKNLNEVEDIVRNSEKEIYDRLKKLELYEKNNKTDNYDSYHTFKLQITLLEMRGNIEDTSMMKVIKSLSYHYPVFDTMKIIYNKRHENYFNWNMVQENQFRDVIDICSNRIKLKQASYCDFEDLLKAYIYSQSYSKFTTETYLQQAIVAAEKWQKNFENEPDPYFYLGVLLLTDGLQRDETLEETRLILKRALEYFGKCKKIYESFENPPRYRYREFQIGKKKNLQALIPINNNTNRELTDEETSRTLKQFEGRLTNKFVTIFKVVQVYRSQYGDNAISEIEAKQENVYTFYLTIGRDGIFMQKPKKK